MATKLSKQQNPVRARRRQKNQLMKREIVNLSPKSARYVIGRTLKLKFERLVAIPKESVDLAAAVQ